ncbi:substrate-binding periplasmic protein [Paraburkholderia phosphatilytica]|uniref:substrate-binding periplasmic protein n=1 Tax=Paraburkholderia phosphatilytica TaxID=2282883 RepID=UPI0019815CA5|nr:transporter substrate-binding domain-containing protein [Paraburkholderia phosphatilytica]
MLIGSLIGLASMDVPAQTVLRIARIADVPDQEVGAEILAVVYAKLGIHVEFVDVPAKRSLIESSSGHLDGEVQRVLDVQREYPTLIAVKEPFNYIEPTAFVKTSSFNVNVNGWESLRPYRIGIVRGVGSSERGTAGMPQVEATATMDQMMLMLAGDRIDVAVNDLFSGMLVLRRLGLDEQLQAVSPPLQHIDMYHFLNVRNRELVPRVEAVIREMRASGELEALRAQITHRMLNEPLQGSTSAGQQ